MTPTPTGLTCSSAPSGPTQAFGLLSVGFAHGYSRHAPSGQLGLSMSQAPTVSAPPAGYSLPHINPFFSIIFLLSAPNYLCFQVHSRFAPEFSTATPCFHRDSRFGRSILKNSFLAPPDTKDHRRDPRRRGQDARATAGETPALRPLTAFILYNIPAIIR